MTITVIAVGFLLGIILIAQFVLKNHSVAKWIVMGLIILVLCLVLLPMYWRLSNYIRCLNIISNLSIDSKTGRSQFENADSKTLVFDDGSWAIVVYTYIDRPVHPTADCTIIKMSDGRKYTSFNHFCQLPSFNRTKFIGKEHPPMVVNCIDGKYRLKDEVELWKDIGKENFE